jgi:rSAM/selenodomain-associated transferase 2
MGNGKPEISIILPVLNESGRISETIAHLRGLERGDRVEIIVVDGDPGGSTIRAIRSDDIRIARSERGRSRQMNLGAGLASGDILLFLHADTELPRNALGLITSAMNEGHFGAGAFDLGIQSDNPLFRMTERYVHLRTRLTRVPFGDQAIFMRRPFFEELGGYRDIPVMEDVEIMKRIRKRGDAIMIIPEKVMTSARRYEREGIIFCTLRNWMIQILYACGVSPERLARFYRILPD